MSVSTNMAICIAVSFFASAAVFYLLRTRLSALEHEVETIGLMAKTTAHARVLEMNSAVAGLPVSSGRLVREKTTNSENHTLIPVSEDETSESEYDSESEYTSDENSNTQNMHESIKTITLAPSSDELSMTLGSSIKEVALTESTLSDHTAKIGGIDNASETDNESEDNSCSENSSQHSSEGQITSENNTSAEQESNVSQLNISSEVASALAAIDIDTLTCPAMRALIVEHSLAPNPSKLRKPELRQILHDAKQ